MKITEERVRRAGRDFGGGAEEEQGRPRRTSTKLMKAVGATKRTSSRARGTDTELHRFLTMSAATTRGRESDASFAGASATGRRTKFGPSTGPAGTGSRSPGGTPSGCSPGPTSPAPRPRSPTWSGCRPSPSAHVLHRWNAHGPDGLTDRRKGNGADPKLDRPAGGRPCTRRSRSGRPTAGCGPARRWPGTSATGGASTVCPETGWRWLRDLGFTLQVPRPGHPKRGRPPDPPAVEKNLRRRVRRLRAANPGRRSRCGPRTRPGSGSSRSPGGCGGSRGTAPGRAGGRSTSGCTCTGSPARRPGQTFTVILPRVKVERMADALAAFAAHADPDGAEGAGPGGGQRRVAHRQAAGGPAERPAPLPAAVYAGVAAGRAVLAAGPGGRGEPVDRPDRPVSSDPSGIGIPGGSPGTVHRSSASAGPGTRIITIQCDSVSVVAVTRRGRPGGSLRGVRVAAVISPVGRIASDRRARRQRRRVPSRASRDPRRSRSPRRASHPRACSDTIRRGTRA